MDPFALVEAERLRLADALTPLTADEWTRPSLCGAWTNHQVAAHLNAPFAVSAPAFIVAMVKARGSFDRANERVANDLARRLDPTACVAGLRANAASHFTPPGFGPEAPLTDTIVHGGDILRPLGRTVDVDADALTAALTFVTSRKAARGFGAVDTTGIRIEPDDVDWSAGTGAVVTGPARSVICALVGRTAFLDDLAGPGADALRTPR
jgi:uncharacterized protein (TIGR03083 family)